MRVHFPLSRKGETMEPKEAPLGGSLAFWAWNDDLKEDELLRQIGELKRAGYRGFFMHSREGLETPYLSARWLSLCRLCAEEARRTGMLPFLYDEDKWPSGMAGGLVTARDPSCAAKAYVYVREKDAVEVRASEGHPWYNGSPPADNLSEKSVRTFLDLTHEAYRRAFGGSLRGQIAGFFTDEPNYWDFFFNLGDEKRPSLPYTDDLPAEFRRRRGYELDPRLLFLRETGYRRHRHDYWRTLAELFRERYTRQLARWCEAQGVRLCGHLLFENDLGYQVRACGSVMPNYREMHVPGIDLLGEQTREYLTVKQCASVAHQYGKEATISETYGCTGWDFSFEGQKRLWDFQCALGIGVRAPHLSFYSIRGLRKRDFPPAFSYQSESFRYNPVIDNYCSRLGELLREGEPMRRILVIHPISGLWCESGSSPDEDLSEVSDMGWTWPALTALNRLGDELNRFAEALVKNGLDFDFGDEQLLAEDGAAEGASLRLARASYSVVILPKTESVFASTAALLQKFLKNGGRLIVVGGPPAMTEGVPAALSFPGAQTARDYPEAVALASALVERPARLTDLHTAQPADVICVFRETADGELFAAVSEQARECRVAVRAGRAVEEEDVATGVRTPVPLGLSREFYVSFSRSDCRIFRLVKAEPTLSPLLPPYRHPHDAAPLLAALPPDAPFSRTMPNALPLDFCRFRAGDGPFSGEMQLWQAQRAVRAQMGFRQIAGNGVEMRYRWIGETHPTVPLALRFAFRADFVPATPLYLCLENAGRMEISCNGVPCGGDAGWFVDRAIRKVPLAGVRAGDNTLKLACEYSHDMELEDVYLAGDFAVNAARALVPEPARLRPGDACLQGYPHYPGSLRFRYRFLSDAARGLLVLGDCRASLVVARVKGKPDVYLLHGDTVELELFTGENELELELVGSNRNLMGPFHRVGGGALRVSWQDFRAEGEDFTPEYLTKPFGLFSPVRILRLP
jgi:hypothetical protein